MDSLSNDALPMAVAHLATPGRDRKGVSARGQGQVAGGLDTDFARQHFAALAATCTAAGLTEAGFADAVRRHVRPLLAHRRLLVALGRLSFDHVVIDFMCGVDYPQACQSLIPRQLNVRERPVLAQWLATRDALVVDPLAEAGRFSARELDEVRAADLGRLGIHGVIDLSGKQASYFSFSHVEGPDDEIAETLRLIAPLLHQAALTMALRASTRGGALSGLMDADLALLKLMSYGRSNRDIAVALGRSEKTVRNRATRLFAALGVASRAEAISLYLREP